VSFLEKELREERSKKKKEETAVSAPASMHHHPSGDDALVSSFNDNALKLELSSLKKEIKILKEEAAANKLSNDNSSDIDEITRVTKANKLLLNDLAEAQKEIIIQRSSRSPQIQGIREEEAQKEIIIQRGSQREGEIDEVHSEEIDP